MIGPNNDRDFDPTGNPKEYDNLYDPAFGYSLVLIVVYSWSATIAAFTRRGFGRRHLSLFNMVCLPIALFFGAPSEVDSAVMVLFASLSMFLMMWHAMMANRRGKLQTVHSRYSGYPRVCDTFGVSEETAKGFVEPALVGGIGIALYLAGLRGLGAYLGIGGMMMFSAYKIGMQLRMRQAMDIRDAELYSEMLDQDAERF